MRWPSAVELGGRCVRSSSVPPSACSSCWMRREMADWVRNRRDAALVSDLQSMTHAKALRLLIIMPNAHANYQNYAVEASHCRAQVRIVRTHEGAVMPLVRIDISKTASCERVRDVGDAVYNAMIAVANVPNYDKFQVVTRHEPDEIIYPEEGYLGIDYTPDLIIIQVTWVGGRSTEVTKKFYQHIADEIHAKQGVRKQDIWISLVDSGREDWSFGNGEMQYAPK